jgi:hypothetical protein
MKYFKKHTKKYKKNKKHTKKYRCVKLTRRNRYKGGSSVTPPALPLVIDKNNIMYSCMPVPTK